MPGVPGAPGCSYTLSRLSSFCGQWMRHSGWYPDPVLRLFPRGAGRFSDDLVHERYVALTIDALATRPDCVGWKMKRYSDDDEIGDGIDGFIVPIRDPAALAERIQNLADDPALRTEMGRAAR